MTSEFFVSEHTTIQEDYKNYSTNTMQIHNKKKYKIQGNTRYREIQNSDNQCKNIPSEEFDLTKMSWGDMIYSQLPHTITSLQHHFEAAHLTHHDINWWGHTCEFPVSSLWVSWDVVDSTGLLVVSSGYYWGLRWLFVVCAITGDVDCSHKEVTKISHLWAQEYELAMTPLQLGRG